jgi:poly-gamma-glutamate capsule biosynthesis protein CapA/YwtB (metallophosphatase superfamily)
LSYTNRKCLKIYTPTVSYIRGIRNSFPPNFFLMKKIFVSIFSIFFLLNNFYAQQDTVRMYPPKDTITVAAVGDMMQGTNYPGTEYLAPNDGKNLFDPVRSILQSADLTFGNSEGTFLDSGGTVKNCNNPKICYAFRQPERYAKRLAEAGFDVVSVANNHVGDFGEAGRRGTMRALDSAGIYYAGLISKPYVIFEKEGVKYGFCAFAPNTGTVDINDIDSAKKIVAFLDPQVDIVIVSFHGGGEGESRNHVTREHEIFLGEDRGNVWQFAHAVIDAGADLVFGSGPHVTRGAEVYKERYISYSCGNFCTYNRFNLKGKCGHAPIVMVKVDRHGKFLDGKIIATKQEGEGGPVPDPTNAVIQEMIELSKTDFPESPLTIDADGNMKIK